MYGVSPYAYKKVLEKLHQILFEYGFQNVDYPGNFAYKRDTFLKSADITKIQNCSIQFFWFGSGL